MKADSPGFFRTFMDAWRNRGSLGDGRIGAIERNFLPAALEIQQTPPSPIGRMLAWSIVILFIIAIIWACLGKIDIVTTADGKTIPSGYVKQIQPLEKGVVKAIHVREGQVVKAGQPLVELDRTLTAADQTKLAKELAYLDQTIKRQEIFSRLLANPSQVQDMKKLNTLFPEGQVVENGASQVDLLLQQWRSHQTQRETLQAQLREKQAEKLSSLEVVRQLEATVPLIAKRTDASKKLSEEGIVAEGDYLKLKEEYIQKSQALLAERARQIQLNEGIGVIGKQLQSLDAEAERKAISDMQDAQRQRQGIIQELSKAQDLNARQVLYAPVAGKVQQLALTTIGGIVQPAQVLMLIVPGGDNLEVEASIQNKDIGFVSVGQKAEVKVHTFPFTRYGVIDATVMDVSKDAVVVDNSAAASKDAKNVGWVEGSATHQSIYKMRLKLAKNWLMVDGKRVELIPGMAVSAEVKTGKRRLIEFFLSPLVQHVDESVRER